MTADAPGGPGYTIAPDGSFTAPLRMAYPYSRTVGPTYERFLRGLADGEISGTVGDDGRVFVPPAEFDPLTGRPLDEWSSVGTSGEVVSWSWQPEVDEGSPLDRPFAWALIRLDGADTAMVHAVDVADPAGIRTGMRVRARFAPGAEPSIAALACFEPDDAEGSGS